MSEPRRWRDAPNAVPPLEVLVSVEHAAWAEHFADVEAHCIDAALCAFAAAPVEDLKRNEVEVSIVLSNDQAVQKLNKAYRGKDQPTNVLSFPSADAEAFGTLPDDAPMILGDIIVAFETVEREAKDQSKSISNHLSHMIVHGMLHLGGYDHEDDLDAELMERIEIQVLAQLGVTDPYAGMEPDDT